MPGGRPKGALNKRSSALRDRLAALGHTDPALFLARIVDDKSVVRELRIQAAAALMPYQHPKHGTIPEPAALVFVVEPVILPYPHATTVAQALLNIEHVSGLVAAGKLDLAAGDNLISAQRIIRDGLIEEAKLLLSQGGPTDQVIRIEGGLPALPMAPGEGPLIMPQLNGTPLLRTQGPLLPPAPVVPPEPDRDPKPE
jgi:hypothetical protein